MAIYSNTETIGPGPKAPKGSIMDRLGIDPAIGFGIFDRSRLPADLVRFADEYDATLGNAGREAARARRLAADQNIEQNELREAIKYLENTKTLAPGFAVVQPPDHSSGLSIGVEFGDGFLMIRTPDLELVTKTFGYRLADWPNPISFEAEPQLPPNALPPVPLAIVRGGAPTELGHDLGGGFRLVRVSDLKFLNSLGWEPSAWPLS
jgi:hypothetical protein